MPRNRPNTGAVVQAAVSPRLVHELVTIAEADNSTISATVRRLLARGVAVELARLRAVGLPAGSVLAAGR